MKKVLLFVVIITTITTLISNSSIAYANSNVDVNVNVDSKPKIKQVLTPKYSREMQDLSRCLRCEEKLREKELKLVEQYQDQKVLVALSFVLGMLAGSIVILQNQSSRGE